jgi:hypothetical protein
MFKDEISVPSETSLLPWVISFVIACGTLALAMFALMG